MIVYAICGKRPPKNELFDGNEYFGVVEPQSIRSTKAYLINWGVRKKRLELDKVIEGWVKQRLDKVIEGWVKQRFDEILEGINSRDSLLKEFDEEMFNALVKKVEILIPTHFVFELKSGMRVEEIGE